MEPAILSSETECDKKQYSDPFDLPLPYSCYIILKVMVQVYQASFFHFMNSVLMYQLGGQVDNFRLELQS